MEGDRVTGGAGTTSAAPRADAVRGTTTMSCIGASLLAPRPNFSPQSLTEGSISSYVAFRRALISRRGPRAYDAPPLPLGTS